MTEPEEHRVREAFQRLRDDAASVDGLAARRRVEHRSSARWLGAALPAAAVAVVALTLVLLAVGNRPDESVEVVASGDEAARSNEDGAAAEPIDAGGTVDAEPASEGTDQVTVDGEHRATPVPDEPAEVMSAGELLESRRMDPVIVEAHLLYRGGSWILCDRLDLTISTGCGGRWLVVVNYDQVVNPHAEPPTGIDAAAFGLAEANPDFATDGELVYSVQPQQLTVESLGDGRVVVPEWPWPNSDQYTPGEIPPHPFSELDRASLEDGPIDVDALRLADTVLLGLGDHTLVERTAAELVDRKAWQLDAEDFRARVGPFSALDLLARSSSGRVLVGRHNHCASPPTPVPDELRDAHQFSAQPLETEIDSCLQWWTVDVFVDDDGRVIGITLDLWEP